MSKLLKNITHMKAHEAATGKKAQQWYSVDDSKKIISFCIQDKLKHKNGEENNKIKFNEGIAQACMGSNEYIYKRFVERKREDYQVRLFIKKENEILFDEVRIKKWNVLEDRINFYFEV